MKGDLLPLPLGMSAEDVAVVVEFGVASSSVGWSFVGKQELSSKAWLQTIVLTLNSTCASPSFFSFGRLTAFTGQGSRALLLGPTSWKALAWQGIGNGLTKHSL